MGSITSIQSLVGRLIDSVQTSNERMDSVQAGGMLRRVPWKAASTYMRQRYARNTGRVDGRVEKRPFPPPPHRSDAGVTHNFSQHSLGICKLAN
jgi:hypothetical protein